MSGLAKMIVGFSPLALAVVLLAIVVAPLNGYEIRPRDMAPIGGHEFYVKLPPQIPQGDSLDAPNWSNLVLTENGRALGPVHSLHADVYEKGMGRLSHWGHTLRFSASDNSDPRTNGRSYQVFAPNVWLKVLAGCVALLVITSLLSGRGNEWAGLRRRIVLQLVGLGAVATFLGVGTLLDLVGPQPAATNEHLLGPTLWRLAPPDLVTGLGVLVAASGIGWLRRGSKGARLGAFAGAAAAVFLVLNAALLGSGSELLAMTPDSGSYLIPNPCRTPGYYLVVEPFFGMDPRWLIIFQLNLVIAALIAVAAACVYATGSSLVGVAVLLLGVAYGKQFSYAFELMTEATFTASFGFAIAGALAYLRARRSWIALAVGIAMAAAIAIKASAPVTLVSAAFLLLLPTAHRLRNAAYLLGPPALCLLLLMGYGRIAHGAWSPTNFMGLALVGNVAYNIRPDAGSAYPELTARIASQIDPVIDKWPPVTDLRDYVERSANDYNPILYGKILPLVASSNLVRPGKACSKELDAVLMTLSREAIQRDPVRYAGHVIAHYLGLWLFAFQPGELGSALALEQQAALQSQSDMLSRMPAAWQASPARIAAVERLAERPSSNLKLESLDSLSSWRSERRPDDGLLVGLAATISALGLLFVGRLPRDLAAPAIAAGFVVPYFVVNAMFQVALYRYTSTAQLGIVAIIALLAFALAHRARWLFVRQKRIAQDRYRLASSLGATSIGSAPGGAVRSHPSLAAMSQDATKDRDKTIQDFGDQWSRHRSNEGRYGSLAQFEDIVAPLMSLSDFSGKSCADIGSGTGRIVRMLLSAGAGHVTAIEPSRAFDVLKANTADVADKVTCLNLRGDELPPRDYDIVVSIGVIHHIPDPKPVLDAALRALKPGGMLLIWVYGDEGSRLYQSIFLPVRSITRRLPVRVNEAIAAILYPMTVAYGWMTGALPFLPLRRYMQEVYMRFTPAVRRLVILDQINPQWAKYYSREEVVDLVTAAGFSGVRAHHRHGYSWTVSGVKPF